MADICPGSCNSAYRATGEGDPRLGDPVWCRTDTARIHVQLIQLDELASLLDFQVNGLGMAATSPVRGVEHPSPSPSGDDLFDLNEMLQGWEDAYRHEHNRRYPEQPWLSRPHRGDIASVTTTTIAWLSRHWAGVLASPCSVYAGSEVAEWHRYLWARTRAGTGRVLLKAPCPWCGLRLLVREEGDDYVRCSNPDRGGRPCGKIMSRDEYNAEADAYRQQLAGSEEMVVTR